MDDQGNIYQKPDPVEEPKPLPVYERTPEAVRSEVRRRAFLLSLIVLALVVFAAVYAWNESSKGDQPAGLKDLLVRPATVTSPPPRKLPPPPGLAPALQDFSFRVDTTNVQSATDLSPVRRAAALEDIRTANEYLLARDWDRAEALATNALALWPDMSVALRMRGLIFTQRGQFDEAIDVLERAIAIDPLSAEAFNTLATAYMQKRVVDKAEELLHTALQIRPGYAVAQVNLGLLYVLTERYEDAAELLAGAAPQLPENGAIPNNLAVCYIRLGRFDDARQQLEALIQRDARRAAPYFNMAITYTLQQDIGNAMLWIRRGAAQCPPSDVQRFMKDQDFDTLRATPEYQAFIRELYPQLPPGPTT